MPEKIVPATTFACASPPRIDPTSAVAKAKIRRVMPIAFIRQAARMKKGIAISSMLWTLAAIFCGIDMGS
jgi:hypothetical protein